MLSKQNEILENEENEEEEQKLSQPINATGNDVQKFKPEIEDNSPCSPSRDPEIEEMYKVPRQTPQDQHLVMKLEILHRSHVHHQCPPQSQVIFHQIILN